MARRFNSFEGDFRRRPEQSLRGSSKNEGTVEIIKRNQYEREKRENHRLRIRSSIVLQAWYRSCKIREGQKILQRSIFDKDIQSSTLSVDKLFILIQRLLFFYGRKDTTRLLQLNQLLLKEKQSICRAIPDNKTLLFRLEGVLVITCKYLSSISQSTEPLAIPMRMLEVFTDTGSYADGSKDVVGKLLHCLIDHGYFEKMRNLLEGRLPNDFEKRAEAPTPLAKSIFELIIRPITVLSVFADRSNVIEVVRRFCSDILCPQFSYQVANYLLPALVQSKAIDVSILIDAIIEDSDSDIIVQEPNLQVPATASLLYSVLAFVSNSSHTLSYERKVKYLVIVQVLMKILPPVDDVESESDSDSEKDVQVDSQTDTLDVRSVLESADHIKCITETMSDDSCPQVVMSICTICHELLLQHRVSIHESKLLNALAVNGRFIRNVWSVCVNISNRGVTGEKQNLLQLLCRGIPLDLQDSRRIAPVLSTFSVLFSTSILSLDDNEFFSAESSRMPFSLQELVPISLVLRDVCLGVIDIFYPDTKPILNEQYQQVFTGYGATSRMTVKEFTQQIKTWQHLFKVCVLLLKQLYARNTRRQFSPDGIWLSNRVVILADRLSQIYEHGNALFLHKKFRELELLNKNTEFDIDEPPPLSTHDRRIMTILTEVPFVVPFPERVKIFRRLLLKDREQNQSDLHEFGRGQFIDIIVRRNYIYEDAFEKLSRENEPNLKIRMRVQMKNVAGLDEAGIDGGGVFREFLSQVIRAAFDPNRGFFKTTTDETLYPNPHAKLLHENYLDHYFFIGRLLGKALYENMLIELPLAGFFVSKILSRHSGDVDINHLSSLDPEMYRNLISLYKYDGDVTDLSLDFTVVNDILGSTQMEELIPDGKNIAVTNQNRSVYIHRMADYRLNKQIRTQCNAFREGLADVLNLEWLRMFDQHELLLLISGAEVPIDISDLQRHTNYSGGYNLEHPVIQTFWDIVNSFTEKQKRLLLKFVTSCSRPPLLGFKELYPAFCIHYGGNEDERLPTASTCMNLLKLPEFKDAKTLRQKLVYAIESESGFELS